MRPIVLDKIASVTLGCRLSKEVRAGDDYPCREGDVIAVRVESRKSVYDQLELTSGRMSQLRPGDVVAGALGHRRALRGYAGRLPATLATGDTLNLLNLGGVLGICESINPEIGPPFVCRVLGQVLSFPYLGERVGVPASIRRDAPALDERAGSPLDLGGIPVVTLAGTCMNAGKTLACTTLVQELVRRRLRVHAGKATGVSMRRDILAMEDAGAAQVAIFTDFGIVTTSRANAAAVCRTLLAKLAAGRPDVIVLELGDGLLGDYGVDSILADPGLRAACGTIVLAASDPVGAWGGVRLLAESYGLRPAVITGPATDNAAGTELIGQRLGLPAFNARVDPEGLAGVVIAALEARRAGS